MIAAIFKRPTGRLFYLFAFIAGAIYPLGLAPLGWWPILILSVMSLVALAANCESKQIKWLCYWYGVGFFAVGASWVHVSIHEFGHAPIYLSVFLTLIFVLFLALFKWLMGSIIGVSKARFGLAGLVFSFPLAWLLLDWFQGVFLTGFPWLYAGYGLVDTWLKGYIKWVGVLGASYWLVLACSLSVYLLIKLKGYRRWYWQGGLWGGYLILAVALNTLAGSNTSPTTPLSLALIQPNIPQTEKWRPENLEKYLERYDRMTEPHWGKDLIIWPEAAIPSLKHRVENWLAMWDKKAIDSGSQLILGIPIYDFESRKIYASVLTLGDKKQRYDKQHLVPFGEFVPFEELLRGLIEFFNLPMSGMSPGDKEQQPFKLQQANLLPAVCYEIAYSRLFHQLSDSLDNKKPNIILTISNDAWFGQSFGPHQHFQIARARAIEFGMPVIRATNTGITAVVDHNGSVLQQIPQFSQQVLAGSYKLSNAKTPYALFGWFWLVLGIVLGQLTGIALFSQLGHSIFK